MNRYKKSEEWFIRQITVGEASLEDSQIRQLAAQLELPLRDCGYFCMALRFDGEEKDPQSLFDAALAAGKTLKNDVFAYISNYEMIMLTVSDDNGSRSGMVEKFRQNLLKKSPYPVRLGVGRSYRDLGKLSYSRVEAIEAIRDSNHGGLCYVDDLYVSRQFTTRKLESQRRRIIELFKSGQLEQMEQNMAQLVEIVRSESPVRADAPYPTSIRRTILEVLFEIMHIGSDTGVDVDKLMDYQDPYSRVFEICGTPELLRWLGDTAQKIYEAMTERQSKAQHNMLERAKACIEANLADPGLSLSLVSQELEITPTYFSAFFIREMGMGFQEYVTGLRIEKAKMLLDETNERISRIAECCGFRSASYFIVVFRKQLGISPNEYRNKK